jgi:hypothetical protein
MTRWEATRDDLALLGVLCLLAVIGFRVMLWLSPLDDDMLLALWVACCSWVHGVLSFR